MKEVDWNTHHRTAKGAIVLNGRVSPMKGKRFPPTKKDKQFALEYIANGGNASKAAKKVDGNKNMAAYRKKKLTFSMLLDKSGVGDKVLAKVLKEGLRATRVQTSPTEPDRDVKDFSVRHKYLETALKVKGHMSNVDIQNNIQVNILDYKENE